MEATTRVSKTQKRVTTKDRFAFVEVLSIIVFVVGFWYLWTSNAIPLYAKTSILTVVGGIFVFAMGQIIQKGYIEPLQELQKVIGEIGSALLVYGNTCDSKINEDLRKEAAQKFRQLSGDLFGRRRVVANYGMCMRLGILPPKQNINEAIQNLTLLSNCTGSDRHELFYEAPDRIKELLWLEL